MSFPRSPVAGKITAGTFRGLNLAGKGKSGPVKVDMTLEGVIREVTIPPGTQWTVHQLRKAINRAYTGALFGLHRLWNEYGMDLKDAIEVLPYLDTHGELRKILRTFRGDLEIAGYEITADAIPSIRSLKIPDNGFVDFELSECVHVLMEEILEMRDKVVRQFNKVKPLQHDIHTFQWFRDEFQRCCTKGLDDDRLLVLMPVGSGGNRHFVHSIRRIIQQANAVGKKVDMLLGLNCVDYPKEVHALRSENTQVKNLYLNEDRSNGMQLFCPLLLSEDVYEHPSAIGGPMKYIIEPPDRRNRNRIFAIRQQQTAWNRGKNPLQRVFVRMLNDRLHDFGKGQMPSQILLADADSWFIQSPTNGRNFQQSDLRTNGLAALLQEKNERNLQMIGARCQSAQYAERKPRGEKIPDFHRPVDDIYRLFDASAPKYLKFMVGGGTLADFPVMLSLLAIISHRYPGSRCEDVHYTAIANRANVRWGIADNAYVTNEVRQKNLDQPSRWLRGTRGLRQLYGPEDGFRDLVDGKGMREEFRGAEWSKAMQTYEKLVADAKEHPDDIVRGDASWNE